MSLSLQAERRALRQLARQRMDAMKQPWQCPRCENENSPGASCSRCFLKYGTNDRAKAMQPLALHENVGSDDFNSDFGFRRVVRRRKKRDTRDQEIYLRPRTQVSNLYDLQQYDIPLSLSVDECPISVVMFFYKVFRCEAHKYGKCINDSETCLFEHTLENGKMRRRNFVLRNGIVAYMSDNCECGEFDCFKSHGRLEYVFHPVYYKTATCKFGSNCTKPRALCGFVHPDERARPLLNKDVSRATLLPKQWKRELFQAKNEIEALRSKFRGRSKKLSKAIAAEKSKTRNADNESETESSLLSQVFDFVHEREEAADDKNATTAETKALRALSPAAACSEVLKRCLPSMGKLVVQETSAYVPFWLRNKTKPCPYQHLTVHKGELVPFPDKTQHSSKFCIFGSFCEHYHEGEQPRRDPIKFPHTTYCCPAIFDGQRKQFISDPSECPRGDSCNYAHSWVEVGYHPGAYFSVPCNNQRCRAPACCHSAHSDQTLSPITVSAIGDRIMERHLIALNGRPAFADFRPRRPRNILTNSSQLRWMRDGRPDLRNLFDLFGDMPGDPIGTVLTFLQEQIEMDRRICRQREVWLLRHCTRSALTMQLRQANQLRVSVPKSATVSLDTLRNLAEALECPICCDRPVNLFVLPCGHGGFCDSCFCREENSDSVCYYCREPLSVHYRISFPRAGD